MARKPRTAAAAKPEEPKPQNTEGADNRLKEAQTSAQAPVPQQPTESKPVGTAGGGEPPATNPPAAEPGFAAATEEAVKVDAEHAAAAEAAIAEAERRAAQEAAPTLSQDVVVVVGPKRGRWRAGRHFGPAPSEIQLRDLTMEELSALVSDPALTVSLSGLDPQTLAAALRPSA